MTHPFIQSSYEVKTLGKRVYPDEFGEFRLLSGQYGIDPRDGLWKCCPPGHLVGNLANHSVEAHEDGTITVTPSILITAYDNDCEIKWHGYLERGIWRQV